MTLAAEARRRTRPAAATPVAHPPAPAEASPPWSTGEMASRVVRVHAARAYEEAN